MFIDGRTLAPGTKITGDVCVIGTGPAGITLARQLANLGLDVVCIESGGFDATLPNQDLAKGQIGGLPYYPLESTRLRYFGGTTGHWGGYCRPFDPIDFAERSWVPHSGWPITYSDVAKFYPEAQASCDLGPLNYLPSGWQLNGLKPLAFSGEAIETRVIQFSPPTRFGTKYRDEFAQSTAIKVYLHSNVMSIDASENGKEITGLSIKTLAGNQFKAHARAYVLAAGGIENARLLLASTGVNKKGLANDNDLVGRFFADHIQLDSAAVLPIDTNASFDLYSLATRHKPFRPLQATGAPIGLMGYITLSSAAQQAGKTLNYSGNIHETYWSDYFLHTQRATDTEKSRWRVTADAVQTIWDNLKDASEMALDRLPGRTKKKFYKVITSQEQAPNPDSRVMLSDQVDALGMRRPLLNWQLTELDRHTIKYAMQQLAMAFGGNGVARVQIPPLDDAAWPSYLVGSWHHCGTTRMSNSEKTGVVDANCKAHGIANLYIAGSSLFPTNGHGNPTLTLIALALRLAEHLGNLLQRPRKKP